MINQGGTTGYNTESSVMVGTGIYHDEYVKVGGEWRISTTGYERIFEYRAPMHADSELITRWSRKGDQQEA